MVTKNKIEERKDNFICPHFEKTFMILGKKWNGLIIESLLNSGSQRFKDISKAIQKCSDRVLVERLKELENEGIIIRKTFSDSSLIKYQLTFKGQELKPVMESVHAWADKFC